MLRLKGISIFGFKSFGDRTELKLAGSGYRRSGGAQRVR